MISTFLARVVRHGETIRITVPSVYAKEWDLQPGDTVQISIEDVMRKKG